MYPQLEHSYILTFMSLHQNIVPEKNTKTQQNYKFILDYAKGKKRPRNIFKAYFNTNNKRLNSNRLTLPTCIHK